MQPQDLAAIAALEGWCTPEKADWLYDHVREQATALNRPLSCLEVGVFAGRSLLAIAFALRDEGRGFVLGIDPYTKDAALTGMTGKDANTKAHVEWWGKLDLNIFHRQCEDALDWHKLRHFCAVAKSPSECCAHLIADGSVDILHLDGNHHESVRDVNLWLPKLRTGGTWIMDDTDWPEVQPARQIVQARLKRIHDGVKWEAYQ
jgi:predicted O-methyltransferase YrrM